MKKYDTKAIEESINIQDVCAGFGLRLRIAGRNTYVSCPNPNHVSEHDMSKKPENCVINRNRLFCYSCGYKADVFQLVATMLFDGTVKGHFHEILDYLEQYCGPLDNYLIFDSGEKKKITKEMRSKLIRTKKRQKALSYFHIRNSGIYAPYGVTSFRNDDHIQRPFLNRDDEFEFIEEKKIATVYEAFDEKFIDNIIHQKINDERGRLYVLQKELTAAYEAEPTNLNKQMLIEVLRQVCTVKNLSYF